MPNPTNITDLNLTTSAAIYLATKLTESGWRIYWQATDTFSGTPSQGDVTLVPEFPNEPNLLIFSGERSVDKVVLPAFSVRILSEPTETLRAGLGEDLFLQNATLNYEGFVRTKAEHLAFATLFRNWFREDTTLPIYDFETDPVSPILVVDADVVMVDRRLDRIDFLSPDTPPPYRYFLDLEVDLLYFD